MNKRRKQGGADSPLSEALAKRDSSILEMVQSAIAHHQTCLAVQPIMNAKTYDQVAFYEGLIRVLDETGRIIPAREFMQQIEDNEIAREIDRQALNLGCRMLHQNPDLRLSVNMSARSIGYQPWMRCLNKWLQRDKYIGARLILEISEKSAMQVPELVVDFMNRLQPVGICFALDNFGAGQTALRHLRDLCFDMVKIDGQFIKGIADNPDNQVLVSAMKAFADQFDMMTIAEQVESANEAQFIAQLGIDCSQGYFYAAPTTQPSWATKTARYA